MSVQDPSEADTAEHKPYVEGDSEPELEDPPLSSRVRVNVGAVTDRGKKRSNNEDSYLVARFGRAMEPLLTNLPPEDLPSDFRETGYGIVVADGMGGHAAGDVASRMAIRTLVKRFINLPDWILRFDAQQEKRAMRRADEHYRRVHEAVRERAAAEPGLEGMGTTMTVATILGADGIVAHVGDSRAYLYREGKLHQITKDQTQAQLLLDAGIISKEEFSKHQYRHVLLQAIGGRGGLVEVEVQRMRFRNDDRLLLCTDGLTDMLNDEKIAEVLARGKSSQDTCDALLELALEAGGDDNITIVLAHLNIPK